MEHFNLSVRQIRHDRERAERMAQLSNKPLTGEQPRAATILAGMCSADNCATKFLELSTGCGSFAV